MPELPEVETVRRSLERLIAGQTIMTVEVREPRLRRPLAVDFAARLTGRVVQQIKRRGKYLHLCLDDNRIWLIHLGMTGQLVVGIVNGDLLPHDHVLIALSNGQYLRYNDTRRFGLMAIGNEEEIAALTELGVEPLSRAFTADHLWTTARTTRRTIKDVLMDQRVVAGIGNIYASELLFRAGVRPSRPAATLSRQAMARVVKAAREVLREAIRHRGSSIADYLDGEGKPGEFQQRFRVYGREDEPCRKCATPIRRETRGGRSAFFCPTCQR
ncbi:MAG: bifunctional DNA-formamidopyrimidine glycosylase/DNA-(apurinic or apyrimidinic site) lyase [Candidatus Binatia bacterium]